MNPRVKKGLIVAGVVTGVLGAVAVAAFLSLDPQALVQGRKDALLADVSTRIGRQLTSGPVTASVGTSLTASIDAISLAGPVGPAGVAGPPQVQVGKVHLQFSLLRALVTCGKDLHVERFTVDGLVLRAARDVDGRWNFQDILDALDQGAAPDASEPKADASPLAGLRVAGVLVRDARVELDDAVVGRPLRIEALNLGVSDIVLGDPLKLWLKANLVDQGRASPVDVRVDLAALPVDLAFDPVPDVDIAVVVGDVDLAPWGALLPVDAPAPVSGTLRVDARAALKHDLADVTVAGAVTARGLVLRDAIGATASRGERQAATRGAPIDLDVVLDVAMNDATTTVKKFTISGSGAAIDASLTMKGSGLAGLKQAAVTGKVADLSRFLTALPPSMRGLPPELQIEGPVDLTLKKDGATLQGALVLDGARVRYVTTDDAGVTSPAFDKAAGKALNLTLKGTDEVAALDISDFALVVDTVKLGGKLRLPTDGDAPFSADVHTGAVSLASLQGLVPPFREAIGRGQKVEGTLQIDLNATARGQQQVADAAIALRGLDINLEGLIARGNGTVTVKATPGATDTGIVANADFDGLQVQQGTGADTSINKPAGLPLRLDVDVKKGPSAATINAVKLVIGKSSVTGRGEVKDIGGKAESLSLDFGAVDVAFNDLRQAIPGAQALPVGGRLKGAISLRGGTSAARLGLDARNLDVTFGSSSIKGTIAVDDFGAPKLDIDLTSVGLAFDDLRGLSASTSDLPAGGRYDGSVKVKGDTAKMSTMQIDAKITRFVAARSDLKGAIKIVNLDKPQFVLGTQSDVLDVDALKAAFGGSSDEPQANKPARDDNPSGLSKATRDLLAGVNGKATLQAKRAIVKGMTMTNFTGVLMMTRGVATFETLDFGFYGGTVSASGTMLDLPTERTRYDIRFAGKDIDFGAFIADQTPVGRIFKGTVSPKLAVKGRGLAPGDFAVTADGPAALSFKQLIIGGLDVLGPIGDAMKSSGKAAAFNSTVGKKDPGLTLNNFTALTKFVGGRLQLEKPIEADTPLGKMTIEGSSSLEGGLDYRSTLRLTPQTISALTGGKAKVKDAIAVPLRIGGSWDKPVVTGIDVKALLAAVVGDAAKAVVDKGKDAAVDAVKDAARDAVGNLLGEGKKPKKK